VSRRHGIEPSHSGGRHDERSDGRSDGRALAAWRWLRGFTLLEVLVATAILGLSLTAILSAQYGAINGVAHARKMSLATGLVRCKMSEIEERLAREGFQELDEDGSGPCCESDTHADFICDWTIARPTLPDPNTGELDLDTDLDSSPLGKLADGAKSGADSFGSPEQGIGGITDALGEGDLGEIAAGGVGGIAQLVMGLVYPDIKALFESASRRVTVTIRWRAGAGDQELSIVQWVINPQQAGLVGELPEGEDPADSDSSSSSTTNSTPSTATGGPTTTRTGGR